MNEEILGGPTFKRIRLKSTYIIFGIRHLVLRRESGKARISRSVTWSKRMDSRSMHNVVSTTGHYGTYGWKGKFKDNFK